MNPIEPYALALGALLGVYIRARVRGQTCTWNPTAFFVNRECITDAVIAGVLAYVWTVPFALTLPAIGAVSWPPFAFPAAAGLGQRAALMGLGAFLFIEIVKIVVLRWPAAFAKYAGVAAVNGGSGDAKPAPEAPQK